MEPFTVGILGLCAIIALIAVGMPVAFGLTLVAFVGNLYFFDFTQTGARFYEAAMETSTSFVLTAVPLFILMGQLVYVGNIGRDLYRCVHAWIGHIPGGLAVTAVMSCAGFGAVTGLSGAAVVTMGTITLPEMKRYGYDQRLATGSIAIASTLAILIPPSLLMVIYGLWTETSIGHLFVAGIVPGLILAALYCGLILIRCAINPALGPVTEQRYSWGFRFATLLYLLPIIFIFTIVIGGIYGGVFTVSEAAGMGTLAVFATLLVMRRITWPRLSSALLQTARLTIMILAIFIAATFFAKFLVITDVNYEAVEYIKDASLDRYVVLAIIIAVFFVLGMVLDTIGMLLLTLPLIFPVVMQLGFDPVWFGILVTLMTEVALVTPPVGFNCFIIRQISPDVALLDVFAGAVPFVMVTMLFVLALIIWPGIALWLPTTL
ncbi:MAG: TRAP transporter large permease [Alphaproteobacteria bacterium]